MFAEFTLTNSSSNLYFSLHRIIDMSSFMSCYVSRFMSGLTSCCTSSDYLNSQHDCVMIHLWDKQKLYDGVMR